LVLLALTACGSSTSTSKSAASAVPASLVTSAAPAAAATATTASGGAATTTKAVAGGGTGCADAAVAVDKVIGSSPDVTGIKVIGGCMVSVSTSLQAGAAGASAALALCDKAADAAYAAGAKSLSFDSIVKHELAAGIKGSQCIGEP
jgi:hypothetical protein